MLSKHESKNMLTKEMLIANYFIYKNQQAKKKGLTNKKLQKLLYYGQAWNLVFNNKKLFDENIEAWVHGPTVPSVYHKFKEYGFSDIDAEVDASLFSNLPNNESQILDAVWDVYGKYDGNYLEVLSHSEEPWQKARENLAPYEASINIISPDDMKKYYAQKIA